MLLQEAQYKSIYMIFEFLLNWILNTRTYNVLIPGSQPPLPSKTKLQKERIEKTQQVALTVNL